MPINFEVKTIIENKIAEIEREYQESQGLILTEDDLKCLIYNKLMQIPELSQRVVTKDQQIYAKSIHTEVSWCDKNGKFTIRPDITILEPEYLSILKRDDKKLQLPSKGFIANGKAIIFELKFIRDKTGITSKTFNGSIMKDYRKIERLFEKLDAEQLPEDVFCYFIIFSKTNKKCEEFDLFVEQKRQSNRHKIIYATGNVHFGSIRASSSPNRRVP